MIKNNLIAFLEHIMLLILTFVFMPFVWKWLHYNENGANPYIATFSLVFWVLYLIIGYFLKPQGTKIKNLLSVSMVAIFGIIFWILIVMNVKKCCPVRYDHLTMYLR